MGQTTDNLEARAMAKELFLASRGQASNTLVAKQLTTRGFQYFTPPTIGNWKKKDKWTACLAPENTSAAMRAVRGREIADLINHRGGEVALLEGVYGEMILAAATMTEKLLAWANKVSPSSLKPDEALAIAKAIPPMVDKAVSLKDRISELRFKGASLSLTDAGSDPNALSGEVLAPLPAAIVSVPKQSDVQPALADALANLAKAKKAAPGIVKDVAPRQRAALKR